MLLRVPWTKTMLEKFIDEGLLTKDEEQVLRTRIAGWSIVKQSEEMGLSTATISRIITNITKKYKSVQQIYPDMFPPLKETKYEKALNANTLEQEKQCAHLLNQFETQCGKDIRHMSMQEIIECQKHCPHDEFYKTVEQ
jgi:hypothetical protein